MNAGLRTVLLSLLGTALGLALVLWGYDRFVVQPREAARAAELQTEVRRAATDEVDRRLDEVGAAGKSLQESVDRSLEQVQKTMSDEATRLQQRAQVTEGLVRASMFKTSIAESYMTMGRWPASAEEAGLPANGAADSETLRSIRLAANGVVEIVFTDQVAAGALIRLIPKADEDFAISWRCEARGFDDVSVVPADCR